MFHVLAAVILLGDLKFQPDSDIDGAVTVKDQTTLSKVADLLEVDSNELVKCLISEVIITRGLYLPILCVWT